MIQELIRSEDNLRNNNDRFVDPIYTKALELLEVKRKLPFVVQVGAFDGKTNDDLFPFLYRNKKWKAILIEPMFEPFEKLKENYEYRKNIAFIHVAITLKKGTTQVWTVPYEELNNPELPDWVTGCTTTVPGINPLFGMNCTSEEFETIKPHITLGLIDTDILQNIFDDLKVKKVDIFQVDTEGLDWDVIRQLNFDVFTPQIIHYETITMDDDQNGECIYFLNSIGYELFKYRQNMTAVLKEGIINTNKLKEIK